MIKESDQCRPFLPKMEPAVCKNRKASKRREIDTENVCRNRNSFQFPTKSKLTESSFSYFFICSFLLLSSLTPVSAFTGDIFENYAHKKHQVFAKGADDWTANSETECLYRFEYERWPCNLQHHREILNGSENSTIKGTKEAAFVQALTAASIIHTSLQICFDGTEDVDCDCKDLTEDRYGMVETGDETNTFVTCSTQYINYAVRVFGKFRQNWLAGKDQAEDLMIAHNLESGRRSLIKRKYEKCSCHGMSGSCSSKTCWEELPQMRHVSAVLKSVYNNDRNNVKTLLHEGIKNKLLTIDSRMVPSKNALVYIEDSPSYCEYMHERNCSKVIPPHYEQDDSIVPEWETEHRTKLQKSCENLCEDCGYDVWERQIKILNTECECVFHWCCTVNCSSCEVDQTLHSCSRSNQPITLT